MVNELPIPAAARGATSALEIVRVWIADENQHFSLGTGVWKDLAAWGLLLADLARHVAASYGGSADERAVTLARIRAGLDIEWTHPTDPSLT